MMIKKKHYMDLYIHFVSRTDYESVDRTGILTADPLQPDNNPRCNSPTHLTVILPVVSGSPAAATDTLIQGLTGTRQQPA